MLRHAAIALLLLLGQAAPKPAFEVATIKRNVSGEGGSIGIEPGGRFRAINTNVLFMISTMYRTPGGPRLFPSQIIGLPDWASSEKYDITGKVSDQLAGQTANVQFRNMAPMVQSLLEDRFKLKLHHDTQPMPVYALVRLKDGALGPKLRPSTINCVATPDKCHFESIPGHYSAVATPITNIMLMIANNVDRVVTDHSGLTGTYDIDLDWAVDAADPDKPSFFTAVQEQLGLKLEFRREPVDVVVIEHVERPTED